MGAASRRYTVTVVMSLLEAQLGNAGLRENASDLTIEERR